jgi:hypothetical protein
MTGAVVRVVMNLMQGFRDQIAADWNADGLVKFLVTLVVVSLYIYFAAKLTGEKEGFGTAIATAFVGSLLAFLTLALIGGLGGTILAIVVWAAVAAGFYRTRWLKGLLIGLVAWVLNIAVVWLVGLIQRNV